MNVERYVKLFVHRSDVYAEQQKNGAYFPVRSPITADDVQEHLDGWSSFGVYVVEPQQQRCEDTGWPKGEPNTIKYVMFDLDTHDEAAKAALASCVQSLVQSALPGEMRVPEYTDVLEYSQLLMEWSGNKGIHVWLFFDEPINAGKVRRWLARDFSPAWEKAKAEGGFAREHGSMDPLEIFPKQDDVPEGGFGNLVKLPLGKHAVSGKFSEFIGYEGWASAVDEVVPLPAVLVPDVEPEAVRDAHRPGTGDRTGRGLASPGPSTPFPCVDFIMREGVGQGVRDNAMFHLAVYLYGHGIDKDLAEEICIRANEEFDPPMRDAEVRHKVDSAYRGRYQSARCGTDWLRDVCPGPCKTGWQVGGKAEDNELRRSGVGDTVDVDVVQIREEEGRLRITVGHPDADNRPTFLVRRRGD